MWRTDMSPVERREAERRVKALLFSSMVGVLVGLMVATVIESEHPAPPRSQSVPGLTEPVSETFGQTERPHRPQRDQP